jgi:hypothetical protein
MKQSIIFEGDTCLPAENQDANLENLLNTPIVNPLMVVHPLESNEPITPTCSGPLLFWGGDPYVFPTSCQLCEDVCVKEINFELGTQNKLQLTQLVDVYATVRNAPSTDCFVNLKMDHTQNGKGDLYLEIKQGSKQTESGNITLETGSCTIKSKDE